MEMPQDRPFWIDKRMHRVLFKDVAQTVESFGVNTEKLDDGFTSDIWYHSAAAQEVQVIATQTHKNALFINFVSPTNRLRHALGDAGLNIPNWLASVYITLNPPHKEQKWPFAQCDLYSHFPATHPVATLYYEQAAMILAKGGFYSTVNIGRRVGRTLFRAFTQEAKDD